MKDELSQEDLKRLAGATVSLCQHVRNIVHSPKEAMVALVSAGCVIAVADGVSIEGVLQLTRLRYQSELIRFGDANARSEEH